MSAVEPVAGNIFNQGYMTGFGSNFLVQRLIETFIRGRAAVMRYPVQVAVLIVVISGLASVNIIASTTLFEPISDTIFFQLLLASNELLALALALYAAYKWDTTLGMVTILVFLTLTAPFLSLNFVLNFPKLLHLQLVALIALFGIWLIGQLQRALRTTQQREREISALAGLNAQVLNERAQLMEEASKGRGQLTNLLKTVCLSGLSGGSVKVAGTFLGQIRTLIGMEFGSFTLVNSDGNLGERIDNFKGDKILFETKIPNKLEQEVLQTWTTQYVFDTGTDDRVTPAFLASGVRSCLCLPVKTDRRLVGILSFYSPHKDGFREDKEFLESVAGLLAGPLLRAELCNDIENVLKESKVSADTPLVKWQQ